MTSPTIITNHRPRFVVDAYELTAAERAEFDYLDWPAIERGEDSATFVRYRGALIDLSEMDGLASNVGFVGWDAYRSDSFFSGVLVRWADYGESVVMGRYYS